LARDSGRKALAGGAATGMAWIKACRPEFAEN
jgi:hypothetical protein